MKREPIRILHTVLAGLVLAQAACADQRLLAVIEQEPVIDAGADTDADTDSDTETETGADLDTDIDLDTDSDTDGDSDSSEDRICDVDLLFVIDNSGSMDWYQYALTLAFPRFADALVDALPSGTNVHVGVTTTEMGYSASGNTMQNNEECMFTGDDELDETGFYITPDEVDTGRNGAQGRLYHPPGQPYFFEVDLDADQADLLFLEQWFRAAAYMGTGGSNIEMLTAPVGWMVHPANEVTNAGFIRDLGTVLVVFFMQDEPDQTPEMIDGKDGGEEMLARLIDAKSGCGGLDCIVAGGFIDPNQCNRTRPIRSFLDGLTRPTAIRRLPNADVPADEIADEMAALLTTTLIDSIQETCDDIVIE